MAFSKAIRSLTALTTTTPTGASVNPGFAINSVTVVYTDTATGNTIAIQALLTDGSTWATIQTITTAASGTAALSGQFLDIRAVVTAHTTTSTIVVDLFAGILS